MKLLYAIFTWLALSSVAFAQVGQMPSWPPVQPAPSGTVPTVYAGGTSAVAPGFPGTTWASAAVDLGPVTATRYITVMVMSGGAGSGPPKANTSVSLGSTPMTKILTVDDGTFANDIAEVWAVQGAATEGSSATVTVLPPCNNCVQPAGVSVVVFDHITTTIVSSNIAGPGGASPSPASVGSITIPANGVAGFYGFSANTSTTNSWGGATGVVNGTTNNTAGGTMSNGTSSTPGTPNAQLTSLGFVTRHMAAIAFGP